MYKTDYLEAVVEWVKATGDELDAFADFERAAADCLKRLPRSYGNPARVRDYVREMRKVAKGLKKVSEDVREQADEIERLVSLLPDPEAPPY